MDALNMKASGGTSEVSKAKDAMIERGQISIIASLVLDTSDVPSEALASSGTMFPPALWATPHSHLSLSCLLYTSPSPRA